jgi:D-alanyl-D-alanine carboxypeptidase
MGRLQQKDPADVLRAYWESKGVTFAGLRLIDGSGLARATMIRPLDLALVNHIARHEAHGDRFRQSLKTYLDGSVRAKLGAMSGVKTEVGFLAMPDGRELTFALMGNGLSSTTDFWSLANRLLDAVRKLPAGTAPE